MTPGIGDIPQFEVLLQEYIKINNSYEHSRQSADLHLVKHERYKGEHFEHKTNKARFKSQPHTEINSIKAVPRCSGVSKNVGRQLRVQKTYQLSTGHNKSLQQQLCAPGDDIY